MMDYTVDTRLDQSRDVTITLMNQYIATKKDNKNPLVGLADSVAMVGFALGIDAVYIWAHMIWETGWGKSTIFKKKHNLFGWSAFDDNPFHAAGSFRNPDHCLLIVLPKIKHLYFEKGENTLKKMNVRYATDQNWQNGICNLMNQIDKFITK